jgi:cell division septal protein FtsQ
MNQRRVRSGGRPVYGRAKPLARPSRTRRTPRLGLLQRRLIILAVMVAVIIYALWRTFEITNITVQSPVRSAEIKDEVRKLLDASMGQRNLLTINGDQLVGDLQQTDPLLRSVEVHRTWPHGIMISATPKQPSMGWVTGNQRYLLDKDGTAIGMLAASSPLPVVTDGSNLPVKIGIQVVSAHFVSFATDLVSALAGQGIAVTGMDVKDTTYDLTVATNRPYKLIFDTSRKPAEEVSDLNSVLALLNTQHKVPAEYVDLRIGGEAYYK